ncbi:ATP-binding protein [Mucilaginibacter sp. KACC 22063]|uniref:ATP-binding protein n=1 Tax=Mucilaginibacter sp. KACC 22063 TaxID=3025666 RepID=UPI002365E3A7|nr:ATP-binding protein [Mucilaginibacter sp. KACC 22063]WDF57245.1 ATP-binding protein [Mucilaginibacter sp. KACC 22063]
MSNAIKYQPAGQQPIILVKTERQDNNLLITVKDNGLGIDPTKHDTIFENIKE